MQYGAITFNDGGVDQNRLHNILLCDTYSYPSPSTYFSHSYDISVLKLILPSYFSLYSSLRKEYGFVTRKYQKKNI